MQIALTTRDGTRYTLGVGEPSPEQALDEFLDGGGPGRGDWVKVWHMQAEMYVPRSEIVRAQLIDLESLSIPFVDERSEAGNRSDTVDAS